MREPLLDKLRQTYADSYMENATKTSFRDLCGAFEPTKVLYEDLPHTMIDGFPIASDYVDADGVSHDMRSFEQLSAEKKAECKLRFWYLPCTHELCVGTTGSGKTTGCVEPQLRAISSQKNKPHLFLTDPKGELFERNAKHLVDNGYKLFVLNFKDPSRSDQWNPLAEMYDTQMSLATLGTGKKMRTGAPDPSLKISGSESDFQSTGYIEYDGWAFPNVVSYEQYLAYKHDMIEAKVESLINQFVNMIIVVQSRQDPTWEMGAQQLLRGMLLCLLEEAVDPNSGLTRKMMNMKTLEQYYYRLRCDLAREDVPIPFKNHPLLKNKSSRATYPLRVALDNAPRTMTSYCGVFDGATRDWFQGHIFALTTGNTIDLDAIGDQPFAIFNITRDYEKSDFKVAGLFVDWVYRQLLERAELSPRLPNGNPSTRPIHFLLDEFGNIPAIKDFENKIATSRSRNIWFHLAVQSYEQVALVYDAGINKRSKVIYDNCNSQVFLGAQSNETKKHFAEECGITSVPAMEYLSADNATTMREQKVLPVSQLDLIREGEIFIKRLRMPVFSSQYIRSYICAAHGEFTHFRDSQVYEQFAPLHIDEFNGPRYVFQKIYEETDDQSTMRPRFDF